MDVAGKPIFAGFKLGVEWYIDIIFDENYQSDISSQIFQVYVFKAQLDSLFRQQFELKAASKLQHLKTKPREKCTIIPSSCFSLLIWDI